jgi:hypothetical protein
MGLEQFLNTDDKAAALEALRSRMFTELYTWCGRGGMDPDDLDYTTFTNTLETSNPLWTYNQTISRLCEGLKIIYTKLGS